MKTPDAATLETLITTAIQSNDWATVADLEPRLDATVEAPYPRPILSSALWYAEAGLHVFPLQPRLKIPHRGTRGLKEATTDRDTIIAWWTRWPDSNLAIATGHQVDVIDIDGPQGAISWARTTDMPDVIGVVATPRIPRGGTHLYLKAAGLKNGAKLLPGIDIRGEGGYVVAPPSIHPNGGIYRWRHPLDFNRILPPLEGPVDDANLCRQCGHPLDIQPHPEHYLKG